MSLSSSSLKSNDEDEATARVGNLSNPSSTDTNSNSQHVGESSSVSTFIVDIDSIETNSNGTRICICICILHKKQYDNDNQSSLENPSSASTSPSSTSISIESIDAAINSESPPRPNIDAESFSSISSSNKGRKHKKRQSHYGRYAKRNKRLKHGTSSINNQNSNQFEVKNIIIKKKDKAFINNFKIATGQKRISSDEKIEIAQNRDNIEEYSRNKERLREREFPKIISTHASDEVSNLTMSSNQYLMKNIKAVKKELRKASCKIDSLQDNNKAKDNKIKALESLIKKQQSIIEEKE